MTTELKDAIARGNYLRGLYAARNTLFDNMEACYLMKDPDEETVKGKAANIKFTYSPDAHNRALGAIRLLIAADPVISVPADKNKAGSKSIADKLEKWAATTWRAASRRAGTPIHYDIVRSAILFAEMHVAVTCTQDLLAYAKGASPAIQARLEEVEESTPFMFDVWDPRTGYPEMDQWGLSAYYREVSTTIGKVLDTYGKAAADAIGSTDAYKDAGRYDQVTMCEWWDFDTHHLWLLDSDREIVSVPNQHPFIPVVVGIAEGSKLFALPEDQREPFLRTLWDSGIWQRQNLVLTAMATNAFSIGVNPKFVYTGNQDELEINYDTPGGVIILRPGESLSPLMKQAIDPSLMELMSITGSKLDESTIFSQTLGAPMGGNASFSMVSLLHQAGRLPLIGPQRMASNVIADCLKIALKWQKSYGGTGKARYAGEEVELSAADIPDYFEIEAKLEASLPQDNLTNANIARQLRGMLSDAWIMENVLNIGQPGEETKRVWNEQASMMQFQSIMQKMQQSMQPTPTNLPPGQSPMQQMPPEQMQPGGPPMEPTSVMPPAPGQSMEQQQGMMEEQMGPGPMPPQEQML